MPSRVHRRLVILSVSAILSATAGSRSDAAPPLFEGLRNYRIVDASGKIAYQPETDAAGRIAYRPPSNVPFLLRGRPHYLAGYAGATYGAARTGGPAVPAGYSRKACGHQGPCPHGR